MKAKELQDLLLFSHLNGEGKISFAAYQKGMQKEQKVIYYASGKTVESLKALPSISRFKKSGEDVLFLTDDLDEFVLQMIPDYEGLSFKNVSSLEAEDYTDEEKKRLEECKIEKKRLLDDLADALKDRVDAVDFSLHLDEAPVAIATKNGLSLQMENVLNENPEAKAHPEEKVKAQKILQANPDHPLIAALGEMTDEQEIGAVAALLYGEALLAEGFDLEDKTGFVAGLNALLAKAYRKE